MTDCPGYNAGKQCCALTYQKDCCSMFLDVIYHSPTIINPEDYSLPPGYEWTNIKAMEGSLQYYLFKTLNGTIMWWHACVEDRHVPEICSYIKCSSIHNVKIANYLIPCEHLEWLLITYRDLGVRRMYGCNWDLTVPNISSNLRDSPELNFYHKIKMMQRELVTLDDRHRARLVSEMKRLYELEIPKYLRILGE